VKDGGISPYRRGGSYVRGKSPECEPLPSLPDGTKVSHTLVKESSCLWYLKYVLGNTVLERFEKEA